MAEAELTLRFPRRIAPLARGMVAFLLTLFVGLASAHAVDAVSVRSDSPAIDLTGILEFQKSETDRIYVAAANRLNNIERLVQKVEQREANARRAAAKALYRIA